MRKAKNHPHTQKSTQPPNKHEFSPLRKSTLKHTTLSAFKNSLPACYLHIQNKQKKTKIYSIANHNSNLPQLPQRETHAWYYYDWPTSNHTTELRAAKNVTTELRTAKNVTTELRAITKTNRNIRLIPYHKIHAMIRARIANQNTKKH